MKKIFAAAALTLIFTISVMADNPVVYKNKKGNVAFDHKAHQAKTECKVCHGEGTPAKIIISGKQAHAMCLNCHKQAKSNKVSGNCRECHQK
jgi:c(7)-type cytochrome triheme protein